MGASQWGGAHGTEEVDGDEVDGDGEEESDSLIFGKYEIGDLLGSGAFGQVRLCYPLTAKTEEYAVKIVDAQSGVFEDEVLSPWEECSILENLDHPNVIKLVETFEDDRFLYVVMELVEGGELFKAIATPSARVKESDVARVGQELLAALEYLHNMGIVHRDVKAENVMLKEPPDQRIGEIKLIDFGMAAVMDDPPCLAPQNWEPEPLTLLCGTPPYCAPELFACSYGPKVDVWAAGVMLYLSLYGQYPFWSPTKDFAEMQEMICDDTEPDYSTGDPSKPEWVSDAGVKCIQSLLAKDPDERPTAEEALSDPWFATKTRALASDVPIEIRQRAYEMMCEDAWKPQVSAATNERRTRDMEAKQELARERAVPSKANAKSRGFCAKCQSPSL